MVASQGDAGVLARGSSPRRIFFSQSRIQRDRRRAAVVLRMVIRIGEVQNRALFAKRRNRIDDAQEDFLDDILHVRVLRAHQGTRRLHERARQGNHDMVNCHRVPFARGLHEGTQRIAVTRGN